MFFGSTFLNGQINVYGSPPFVPTDLGTTKLRFWTRPESQSWTTSARSVLETGTGVIGSKDDESGNGFHLIQATSGSRPTRKTNGGFYCSAKALYTNAAVGAWSGDFDVWAVFKAISVNDNYRFMEVSYATGFGLLQSAPNSVKFACANPVAPYGFDSPSTIGTSIHVIHAWRIGTTALLSIDGGAPSTDTVTGSALTDTAFFVGLSNAGSFGAEADHHEIAICTGLTSGNRIDMDYYFYNRLSSGIYV